MIRQTVLNDANLTITYDFKTAKPPSYVANTVGDILFRLTNAQNFPTLFYFLANVRTFESLVNQEQTTLYWYAEPDTGYVDIAMTSMQNLGDIGYQITYNPKNVTVTINRVR